MPVFKNTYFWSSESNEGWSESFYVEAGDIEEARTRLDTMLPLLLALRDSHFQVDYARTSDVGIRGDSLPSAAGVFPQPGTYTPPLGAVDLEANSALLVELFVDSLTKNHWFLRGLTTSKIAGRVVQVEATWDANFAFVVNEITTNGYQTRTKNPTPPPTKIYRPIIDAFVVRATARKPGRPFNVVRGRRSRRGP